MPGRTIFATLIITPIDIAGGTVQDLKGRFFGVLAGMIASFVLGLASGVVGSDALPGRNSRPHWKMCRVCAGTGIAFGILAMLAYLVFIALLPVIFPLPR